MKIVGNRQQLRLLLKLTIIAIVSYALGALTHSEIMHFFLGS